MQCKLFFLLALVLIILLSEQVFAIEQSDSSELISSVINFNNQLRTMNSIWQIAKYTPFSKLVLDKSKSISIERKETLLRLAKEDPSSFLKVALSSAERKKLPLAVQENIEFETELVGNWEVAIFDDFENYTNSRIEYFLRKDSQLFSLSLTYYPSIISQSRVMVKGWLLGELLVADSRVTGNLEIEQLATLPDSTGTLRLLVIPIEFLDSGARPLTPQEINERVFSGPFQQFYQEQSYSKLSFAGQVTDWLTLQRNGPNISTGTCAILSPGIGDPEIQNFILASNLNLTDYYGVVLAFNHPLVFGACGTVGQWVFIIGGQTFLLAHSWIALENWNFSWSSQHPFTWLSFDHFFAHEIGHNLGVLHANAWDCGDQQFPGGTFPPNCAHIEYGDVFDTMGYGYSAAHFNVRYKEVLEWIRPEEILTIQGSGRYTINPLEAPASLVKAAKIQLGNETPYYLEYRRAIGFDAALSNFLLSSNQDGLFLIYLGPETPSAFMPRMLDLRPTPQEWWTDFFEVTLNNAAVFEDFPRRISIGPIINVTPTSITFDVTFNASQYNWWPMY